MGLATSINFRIQGHKMKLVEVEGSHTLQNTYTALDIHLGQSYSVLVTADQPAQDYYIVVSTRFTARVLTTTAVLHYSNSYKGVSGPIPGGPTTQIDWSLNQARSIRYLICLLLTITWFLTKADELDLFVNVDLNQLESDCKCMHPYMPFCSYQEFNWNSILNKNSLIYCLNPNFPLTQKFAVSRPQG